MLDSVFKHVWGLEEVTNLRPNVRNSFNLAAQSLAFLRCRSTANTARFVTSRSCVSWTHTAPKKTQRQIDAWRWRQFWEVNVDIFNKTSQFYLLLTLFVSLANLKKLRTFWMTVCHNRYLAVVTRYRTASRNRIQYWKSDRNYIWGTSSQIPVTGAS